MAEITPAAALAVFVKTPELSPVKTRLAADIGARAARAVYQESVALTRRTMRAVNGNALRAYWAVGEKAAVAHSRWRDFPALWTGDGGLGARLHHVYASLRRRHRRVILIGSDSPQVGAETLLKAAQPQSGTVIGAATDGGFYLFAADIAIARATWESVEYSRHDTLAQLRRHFSNAAALPPLTDIDDAASLRRVIGELQNPQQAARFRRLLSAAAD